MRSLVIEVVAVVTNPLRDRLVSGWCILEMFTSDRDGGNELPAQLTVHGKGRDGGVKPVSEASQDFDVNVLGQVRL